MRWRPEERGPDILWSARRRSGRKRCAHFSAPLLLLPASSFSSLRVPAAGEYLLFAAAARPDQFFPRGGAAAFAGLKELSCLCAPPAAATLSLREISPPRVLTLLIFLFFARAQSR